MKLFSDPLIAELCRDIVITLLTIFLFRVLRILRKFEKKVSEDLDVIKNSLPPPKEDITPVDFPPRNKK